MFGQIDFLLGVVIGIPPEQMHGRDYITTGVVGDQRDILVAGTDDIIPRGAVAHFGLIRIRFYACRQRHELAQVWQLRGKQPGCAEMQVEGDGIAGMYCAAVVGLPGFLQCHIFRG